ncbi:MAG TPA: addiction module protein [Thermoanaerobaculia bacterium]|nr:addiction module protein [Thermoanaerobaculia bacterium]
MNVEFEFDEDIEAAWAEEVERRIREIDSGEVKTIPWEQVRAELFALVNNED